MFKELFTKQRDLLDTFYSQLKLASCDKLLDAILSCKGTLFFTGIGKSGFIAQKIAATMLSTGTKAAFLSPIDALHGDLAMVEKGDIVMILSKSGETDELIDLLPFLHKRNAHLVAITSNEMSRLAKRCGLHIFLPCSKELCPFDLAPTISTEIQLLFGDVLAVVVMEAKGFTLDEYAKNHPSGRIGRRASIKVSEMMRGSEQTPFCTPETFLEDVLVDFSEKRCGCLIVIDENKRLKGIFTDGDLRRALQEKGELVLKERVGNLMTSLPKSISSESLAWEAMKLMESENEHPVMVLPVLDDQEKEVIGVLKMHDLIQAGL